ncbi:uncharacterized protein LOC111129355 [Crassostrea virginica]
MRILNVFYCFVFAILNEVNSDSNKGSIENGIERKEIFLTRSDSPLSNTKTDSLSTQSLHYSRTFYGKNVDNVTKDYTILTTVLIPRYSGRAEKVTPSSKPTQWMSRRTDPVNTVSQGSDQRDHYVTTPVLLRNSSQGDTYVTNKYMTKHTYIHVNVTVPTRKFTHRSTELARNTTQNSIPLPNFSRAPTPSKNVLNESTTVHRRIQPTGVAPLTDRVTIRSTRTKSDSSEITSSSNSTSSEITKQAPSPRYSRIVFNITKSTTTTTTKKHKQWTVTKAAEKNPTVTPSLSTKTKHQSKSSTTKESFKSSYFPKNFITKESEMSSYFPQRPTTKESSESSYFPAQSNTISKGWITEDSQTTFKSRSRTPSPLTVPTKIPNPAISTTNRRTESTFSSFTLPKEHKKPNPTGKTKILINEIAISQNSLDEQFIELKVSSDYTHGLESYEVVVFSGMGEVLSVANVPGDTSKRYTILASEDIHVNIIKELQSSKSLAVAVYHRSESASGQITMQSKGVMDAIVLTAYDGRPSDQLMQNLMNDNVTPFHVSASALQHGGSISRCAENHVRDTQDFMELSKPKATRGFKNAKCPSDIRPSVNDKPIGNYKLTLIVVTSCLALFCVIVFFVVTMMKRKQQEMKLMQASLWKRDEDDEEVVLKMGSVNFEGSPEEVPTFSNDNKILKWKL